MRTAVCHILIGTLPPLTLLAALLYPTCPAAPGCAASQAVGWCWQTRVRRHAAAVSSWCL